MTNFELVDTPHNPHQEPEKVKPLDFSSVMSHFENSANIHTKAATGLESKNANQLTAVLKEADSSTIHATGSDTADRLSVKSSPTKNPLPAISLQDNLAHKHGERSGLQPTNGGTTEHSPDHAGMDMHTLIDLISSGPGSKNEAARDLRLQSDKAELSKQERDEVNGLQEALIKGDTNELSTQLRNLNPEDREKVIGELNKEFNSTQAGIQIEMTDKDHVALYGIDNPKGVEFDLKTGDSTVRAVSKLNDGSAVLYGQVMGQKSDAVVKDLSVEAIQNIATHDSYSKFHTVDFPPILLPPYPPPRQRRDP